MSVKNIDNIWNKISCKFSDDEHLLYKPIILECKNRACLMCLLEYADKNANFQCNYCNELHTLIPFKIDYELSNYIEEVLKNNKTEVCLNIKNNLSKKLNEVISLRDDNINFKFESNKRKFEENLDERIKKLKDNNDVLLKESLETISNFKKSIIDDIERSSSSSLQTLEKISDECINMNAYMQNADFDCLNRNIINLENYLKTLDCLGRKATMFINQIHFEESNSINKEIIGSFKEISKSEKIHNNENNKKTDDLDFFELINNKNTGTINPKYIKEIFNHDNKIIKLNTRYIINDSDNNLLILNLIDNYLYKLNFYGILINSYNLNISDVQEDLRPRGICLNKDGELFLTNISNHKIIKYTSENYLYMKQFGDGLNDPRGIECYGTFLFICDYNHKRIRIYDNGNVNNHISDIKLDESTQGSFYPFNIKIKFENIFVTDLTNSIRIFDLIDFSYIDKIEHAHIIEPRGLIIDNKGRICITSKSTSNKYSLYCYDSYYRNFKSQLLLGYENVFDILILKHKYNNDIYLYASVGDSGLLYIELN